MRRAERANVQPFSVTVCGRCVVPGPAVNWIPEGCKSPSVHRLPATPPPTRETKERRCAMWRIARLSA
jgi:hypothetical protein